MASDSYLPFSQRTGLEAIPPQLKLGEASGELRRLLVLAMHREINRSLGYGPMDAYFEAGWRELAMDLHVRFFKQGVESFRPQPNSTEGLIRATIQQQGIGRVFNLVEFIIRHRYCGPECVGDVAEAFVESRAAYRVIDKQIVAIGTEEQAAAFERAVTEAEAKNATAARKQLIAAGVALRNSDWAGSVRESIHAVEAMAVRLAPGTDVLGEALKVLEQRSNLHGGLKKAFAALYGYSSDQEGVRHALVFDDEAKVDEADALFMLGACASFVSYLLARGS